MKAFILVGTLFLLPSLAMAELQVVTTTQDLAAIAEAVGGDAVEVTSLIRGDEDPHYIEPKPSYAGKLNRADLLIHVGLELEIGWLPVLLTQSRNANIQTGQRGNLNASTDIPVLEIPVGPIDRSLGDVHPSGNPHYWLDPRNGILIAQSIAGRLIELDPDNREAYEKRRNDFQNDLRSRINSWEGQLKQIHRDKLVTYHKTFSYFVAWADLEVVGQVEPKPGIPPSPAHVLQLIEMIPQQKVKIIMMPNFNNPKPAQEIAKRTDTKLLIVPVSVAGVPAVKTYSQLFDYLVEQLVGSP